MMGTKVCVIGAGASGLVVLKELLAQNITAVCYEAQAGYGGAFRSTKQGGRAYASLQLTVSNYFMAYSDFMPDPTEKRTFWDVDTYQAYLQDYITAFQLAPHIQYNHHVTHAAIQSDETVAITSTTDGTTQTQYFDHVIICAGSNYQPFTPAFKGLSNFQGQVIHASEYKEATTFANKKVVCIGLGESGADITHQVSQVTDCTVLVREYPNVVPRWIKGHTSDAYTAKAFNLMGKRGIDHFMKLKAWFYLNFDKKISAGDRLIQQWIIARKSFMGKFLTKSDIFIQDIITGKLELLRDEIDQITARSITTKKGTKIEADVLLCNTGYTTSFDNFAFGTDFENPRQLFKHMLHPDYGTKVCTVGWARPTQGGLPACSEMQARYIALLIAGHKQLPSKEHMQTSIDTDQRFYKHYFSESSNIKSLVNYHHFMHDMGQLIGCTPKTLWSKDLSLSLRFAFGAHLSVFYRLNDPKHQKKALKIIKSLPIAYSPRRMLMILLFIGIYQPLDYCSRFIKRTT